MDNEIIQNGIMNIGIAGISTIAELEGAMFGTTQKRVRLDNWNNGIMDIGIVAISTIAELEGPMFWNRTKAPSLSDRRGKEGEAG